MAFKIKNINYSSISSANEYAVYTVVFEVEDTKSNEEVSFTQDFYFANGTKQDEVTASVISLLSGAVSIMYNKATHYNLSITSDEVADVISTVFTIPDVSTVSTATEVPVVEESSSTATPIDSFSDTPSSTETVTETVEEIVSSDSITTEETTTTTTESTTDSSTTTDSTDTTSTDTTDTTESNG